MECPVCGDRFSELVIQYHAWNCDGSKLFEEGLLTQRGTSSNTSDDHPSATCTSYFQQHLNEMGSIVSSDMPAVPHGSTEHSQETAMVKVQECPLCNHYLPSDQIVEHAAFCNGPSYSRIRERETPSYSRIRERETPSYSRIRERETPSESRIRERETPSYSRIRERETPSYSRIRERETPSESRIRERETPSEDASSTMELFWSYVRGKERPIPGAAAETEVSRKVLRSTEEEGGTVLDLEKALQYLDKIERCITQDPEFKQVFGPLLKSPNPLHILQCLSNAIFSRRITTGAGKVAPIFLFFHLAKLFLPTILESEPFAIFKKWVEEFILRIVLPRISQIGGWGSVLCAVGALLASGLIIGLAMLLMTPKSNK
ncbi:uncharacterized protein LOC144509108 isoform X2 [Mustelus asterias]